MYQSIYDVLDDTTIVDKGPAPLYDSNGSPLERRMGGHLCASYLHAAHFNYTLLKNAGMFSSRDVPARIKTLANSDVEKSLRNKLAFWRPADVLVVSADGYLILAKRSADRPNHPGLCIHSAAGFPHVINGKSESDEACAMREAMEELGGDAFSGFERFLHLGTIKDRSMQYFSVPLQNGTQTHGVVPSIAPVFGVKSRRPLRALMQKIHANHESQGMVALKLDDLEQMIDGQECEIPYFPRRADGSLSEEQKIPARTALFMRDQFPETIIMGLRAFAHVAFSPLAPKLWRISNIEIKPEATRARRYTRAGEFNPG